MQFVKRKCPRPKCQGMMTAQEGKRGKYYRCPVCGETLNKRPQLLRAS